MDTESSPARAPLVDKANSPPPALKQVSCSWLSVEARYLSRSSSSRSLAIDPSQVRRKSSFIRQIDSSEECPSPHDSIYEAYFITASDESSMRLEQSMEMVDIAKLEQRTSNIENERMMQDAEFLYGRGTILDTISEKHSNGTIRSVARPRSADNIHDIPFLGHRNSILVAKSPRRQQSFSMDDMKLIKQSYHEVCTEIYASPKASPLKSSI